MSQETPLSLTLKIDGLVGTRDRTVKEHNAAIYEIDERIARLNEQRKLMAVGLDLDMIALAESVIEEYNKWLGGEHLGLTCYPKGEYGWFIYVGHFDSYHAERFDGETNIPGELQVVMRFAQEQGCDWLCFDRDADEIDGLVVFDWR